MANSCGRVFISYRRKRLRETSALVRALEDRGIPTWLDINNLANEPTEAAIREVLNDEDTSGAILWLTPDVEESEVIRAVEVPEAVGRRKRDKSFWLVIVLADGLDYAAAGQLFKETLGGEDLSGWNLTKVTVPWATSSEIKQVAASALGDRLTTIFQSAEPATAACVGVHAKGTFVRGSDEVLTLDWTGYFADGPPNVDAWEAMSEAAQDVATTLKQEAPDDTSITFSGTPSVPASILVGSTYSGRDGHVPTWIQRQPNGFTMTEWSMRAADDATHANACGWRATDPIYRDPAGKALAMCMSVSDNVSGAFARSQDAIPDLRGLIRIEPPHGRNARAVPLTAEEAASLVHLTVDAIREFRTTTAGLESIHFFLAGPAGFAFLLGTRLATLPRIVTYEYDTVATRYVRAATITT